MIQIKRRHTGAVLYESSGSTLRGANLGWAILSDAYLREADLCRANLRGAYLRKADLEGADLEGADLYGADLREADLSEADLSWADLSDADLSDADLSGANLEGAYLRGAYLRGANLEGANLEGANLEGANLEGAKLPDLGVDARALRLRVADHIEAHPELHDQREWGDGADDEKCNTRCCVAGWACHLGGGDRDLGVATAATLLLHVDGLPMPSFDPEVTREEIVKALRAQQ